MQKSFDTTPPLPALCAPVRVVGVGFRRRIAKGLAASPSGVVMESVVRKR